MFPSASLLPLLLACAGWANAVALPQPVDQLAARAPRPGLLVGYRAMSKAEHQASLARGRVIYDRSYDRTGYGAQLGPGVYTGMTAKTTKNPSAYVCAVLVTDKAAWDNTHKYNVPEYDGCEKLWGSAENIEAYGRKLDSSWTNENTVRFAKIVDIGPTYQALIGPGIVDNIHFGIDCCDPGDSACVDRLEKDYGEAKYGEWNIRGGNPAA